MCRRSSDSTAAPGASAATAAAEADAEARGASGAANPADAAGTTTGDAPAAAAFAAALPADDPRAGLVRVHRNLDYHLLIDLMAAADEIVILNTWIPELNILAVWDIGLEFEDLTQWETEMESMGLRFGLTP